MHQTQVTILMPVFNGAATLGRAIDSILAQTYPNWKLLVLEDGSTDCSLSLAKSYKDSRIQVISTNRRLGIVMQLNRGITLTESPYIARMDADDVAYPNRLEKQIAFLESHPHVDLVGCAIRILDKAEKIKGERFFPPIHAQIVDKPWLKTLSVAHPTWCGRTVWFKKWWYQDYMRNEDQELLFRAAAESQYANLSEILLDYYEATSFLKKYQARWGWILVVWKHYLRNGHILRFMGAIIITITKFLRSLVV